MGCCLYVDESLVGVLTLDALQVGAFSNVDDITVQTLAALAAATIRNAQYDFYAGRAKSAGTKFIS